MTHCCPLPYSVWWAWCQDGLHDPHLLVYVPPRAVKMMDLTSLIRLFYSTEDFNWRKIIWVDLTSPCESFKSESNKSKTEKEKASQQHRASPADFFFFFFPPCSLWDLSSQTRDWTSFPLHWELRVLTAGLQGNFLLLILKKQLPGCEWDYMAGNGEWLLGADDKPW